MDIESQINVGPTEYLVDHKLNQFRRIVKEQLKQAQNLDTYLGWQYKLNILQPEFWNIISAASSVEELPTHIDIPEETKIIKELTENISIHKLINPTKKPTAHIALHCSERFEARALLSVPYHDLGNRYISEGEIIYIRPSTMCTYQSIELLKRHEGSIIEVPIVERSELDYPPDQLLTRLLKKITNDKTEYYTHREYYSRGYDENKRYNLLRGLYQALLGSFDHVGDSQSLQFFSGQGGEYDRYFLKNFVEIKP